MAAGTVLAPGTIVPAGKLVLGIPGRVVRELGEADRTLIREIADRYVKMGKLHRAGRYPNVAARPE